MRGHPLAALAEVAYLNIENARAIGAVLLGVGNERSDDHPGADGVQRARILAVSNLIKK